MAESKLVSEDSNVANKGRVLVTGATGFVALHCIAELLKNGYKVVGTLRNRSREKKVKNGIEDIIQSNWYILIMIKKLVFIFII